MLCGFRGIPFERCTTVEERQCPTCLHSGYYYASSGSASGHRNAYSSRKRGVGARSCRSPGRRRGNSPSCGALSVPTHDKAPVLTLSAWYRGFSEAIMGCCWVPPGRLERPHPAPEAGALSAELWGPAARCRARTKCSTCARQLQGMPRATGSFEAPARLPVRADVRRGGTATR